MNFKMQLVICFTYLSPFEAPFEFHEKKSTEPWSHAFTRPEVSEALDGSVHCHGSQHSSHQLGGIATIGRRRSCTATWDNLLLNLSHLEGC